MRERTRRKIEMGRRVLEFTIQHPDPSPAFELATARLKDLLARANQLGEQQIDGRTEVRAAASKKRELRQLIKQGHLNHLTSVARLAAVDEPEALQKLAFPTDATSYLAFQMAANGLVAEAESRKELLVKHGLSEEVLSGLRVRLDEFEAAVQKGDAGRLTHVAATAELDAVSDEVGQVAKVMNGLVRVRSVNQEELLAAWESATSLGFHRTETKPDSDAVPPAGTTPPSGTPAGDVKPAA
jgi:hypothetical protein